MEDGTFAAKTDYSLSDHPYSLSIADIDGDGDEDILVAQYYSNIAVFTNDGAGNFSQLSSISVPGGPYAISASDLNGDGGIDIADINFSTPSQLLLLRTSGVARCL